jgi:hypothetical protein
MKLKGICWVSLVFLLCITNATSATSMENRVTHERGTPLGMDGPQDRAALPSEDVSRVAVRQFVFELKECKRLGDRITCQLLITNNDKDQSLRLESSSHSSPTRMIDNNGDEHLAADIQFGAKKGDVETVLVTGIPVKATIVFEPVVPEVEKLSLLEIYCLIEVSSMGEVFSAQFRNVPLAIAPTVDQKDSQNSPTVVTKGFTFKLISCKPLGKDVSCSFSVTNEDSERKALALHVNCSGQRTYTIDDSGSEYRPVDGSFGKAFIGRSAGGSNWGCYAEQELAPRAITNGLIRFEGINPNVILLKLMRLKFSTNHYYSVSFDIDFRDIPINR